MKRSSTFFRAFVALSACLLNAVSEAQNSSLLLTNGSFENGHDGWLPTGNQTIAAAAPYFASDGSQLLAFNAGNTTPNGTLSQNFTTSPGRSYLLEYDVGVLAYNTLQQRLQVSLTGNTLLLDQLTSINGTGNGTIRWAPQRFTFVADSPTTSITFRDQSTTTTSLDLLLDDVRITELEPVSAPPLAVPDHFYLPQNSPLQVPAPGVLFNDTARPVKIMPLGDSITRGSHSTLDSIPGGYRKKLASLLAATALSYDLVGAKSDNPSPGLDPDHQGTDGIRTDQVLSNLPTILSFSPDIILLHLGSNDILQNVAVSNAVANLSALIDQITALNSPLRKLYVATLIPIAEATATRSAAQLNAAVDTYNVSVRSLVQQYASLGRRVVIVEMNANVILSNGNPNEDFFQAGDGIHPAASGYDQMAKIWFDTLSLHPPLEAQEALIQTLPSHGNLVLTSQGGFTYTPAPGFIGVDSFTYQTKRDLEISNSSTVILEVLPPWHAQSPRITRDAEIANIQIFATIAGTYHLEKSNDLIQWNFHSSMELQQPGWIEFQDDQATAAKQFYRIGKDN